MRGEPLLACLVICSMLSSAGHPGSSAGLGLGVGVDQGIIFKVVENMTSLHV